METGTILANRYTVDEHIGSGPTGSVWFGHDTVLDKPVRIKTLWPRLSRDDDTRERFRRAALTVAELHQPDIVDVYDCIEHRDGDVDVACQIATRVEGAPLRDILDQRATLEPSETLTLIADVAAVVYRAHQAGVCHHNLTPDNLIVGDDGVTVVDFGFAVPRDGGYTAPELTRGELGGAESDVFSLGAIAFECLTGAAPGAGDATPATLADTVSPALAALLTKALAADPHTRFDSAEAFAIACRQVDLTAEVLAPLLRRDEPGTDLVPLAPSTVAVVEAAAVAPPQGGEEAATALDETAEIPVVVAPADPAAEESGAAASPTDDAEAATPPPDDAAAGSPPPDDIPAAAPPPEAEPARGRRGRWVWVAAAAIVAVIAAISIAHFPFGSTTDTAGGQDPAGAANTSSSASDDDASSSNAPSSASKSVNDPETQSSSAGSSHKPSSKAPDPKVPFVVGHDARRASGELEDAGFKVNTITSGDGRYECPVRDQSPEGGTTAPSGSTVDISVRRANNFKQCYRP